MKNYCYVAADPFTREALLVDPAFERDKIQAILDSESLRCTTVLLTHSHHDHVDLTAHFAATLRCRVLMSRRETEFYGFECPGLMTVEDQQWIPFGETGILPLLTPGHTAGGVCFRVGNNLFTGDTLFAEGCGMCLGAGADPFALFESLQLLKDAIHPDTAVYPGHSYGVAPGQKFRHILENNIYLHFQRAHDFVAYRMRKGQTGWLNFR